VLLLDRLGHANLIDNKKSQNHPFYLDLEAIILYSIDLLLKIKYHKIINHIFILYFYIHETKQKNKKKKLVINK
jgi:hypothetical protein